MTTRRSFLAQLALGVSASVAHADPERPRRILLRSAWQTVNIGDIAHTPGVLALLEAHLPGVAVTLWPGRLDNGVEALLRTRFPTLTIADTPAALKVAFAECDLLLHGSGPSLVAERDVMRWDQETGKPFGVYGITLSRQDSTSTSATPAKALATTIALLGRAKFVYFRDSKSLALAKELGCTCPLLAFGPDGAFACDLRDDARATAFLTQNQLEVGRFLCCIPRLRYTPYWLMPSKNAKLDPVKQARNDAMKEHDMSPLRQAITEVVRRTAFKVLLCPEDQSQMRIGKELVLDKLPADVVKRVVWRANYWLPSEALSTYTRSAGLFGHEMHSPILCVGHGVPAIVCRTAEQTTKGFMWQDIGLGEWLFDLDDEAQMAKLVPAVLELAQNPAAARVKAEAARGVVRAKQQESMTQVRSAAGL